MDLVWWGPARSGRWEQKGLCLAICPAFVGHHRGDVVWKERQEGAPTGMVEGTLVAALQQPGAVIAHWSCLPCGGRNYKQSHSGGVARRII